MYTKAVRDFILRKYSACSRVAASKYNLDNPSSNLLSFRIRAYRLPT